MEFINACGVLLIIFLFLGFISLLPKSDGPAKIYMKDRETGRTVHVGNGDSISRAMVDLAEKTYRSITENSREETIRYKLEGLRNALYENDKKLRRDDKEVCYKYLRSMEDQLKGLEEKRLEKERAAREAKKEADRLKRQRKREAERKEKERLARIEALPEQRRFVAEQRRIMTDSMRYDILQRDGFRCQLCGATAKDMVQLHVDHIVPVSKGGKTEPSNLRTLCERCNMGKRDKIEDTTVQPSRNTSDTSKESSEVSWSKKKTIEKLEKLNIRYMDHVEQGGWFWIERTPQSDALLRGKKIDGQTICTTDQETLLSDKGAMYVTYDNQSSAAS